MYDYYSRDAHGDALSVRQMREARTKEDLLEFVVSSLFMLKVVLSKMILLYRDAYESARACCDDRPQALAVAESYDGAAGQME